MSDPKRTWLRQLGVTSLPPDAPAMNPAPADAGGAKMIDAGAPSAPDTGQPGTEQQDDEMLNVVAAFGNQNQPKPDQGDGAAPEAPMEGKGIIGDGLNIPGIPLPIPIPDVTIQCKITIDNQSEHMLELIPGSVKLENPNGSEFDTPPPKVIAKNHSGIMQVSNNFPFVTGVGGELAYKIADDEQQAQLFIKWERGRVPKRAHTEEIRPDNPKKYSVSGGFNGDEFTFTFVGLDGPGPGPGPGPAPESNASCNITVTNNTKSVLKLVEQGHDFGDFMSFPAASLQPGASCSFISVHTPNAKDKQPGCKGFATWDVGDPAAAVWRIDWNNPVGEKNTAAGSVNPASQGFDSLAQIGQGDENVPVAFTLSGGAAPGPGPGPEPGPGPGPDKPFLPPPQSKQPTLRKGDSSPDGWVEYLQQLLGVPVDGKFGPATLKAVTDFQSKNGLQVDGTVGNQTWAALRHDTPEKPSTDGREPHTFVETGKQARWYLKDEECVYFNSTDALGMMVESVGEDVDIADFDATFKITPPNSPSQVVSVKIGPHTGQSPTGQGNLHQVNVPDFLKNYPAKGGPAKPEDYELEAFLDGKLGGDRWKGKPTPK